MTASPLACAVRRAAVTLLLVMPAAARAQPSERWSVQLLRGKDTITTERVTLGASSVSGDLLDRSGGSRLAWRMDRTPI